MTNLRSNNYGTDEGRGQLWSGPELLELAAPLQSFKRSMERQRKKEKQTQNVEFYRVATLGSDGMHYLASPGSLVRTKAVTIRFPATLCENCWSAGKKKSDVTNAHRPCSINEAYKNVKATGFIAAVTTAQDVDVRMT